jgi:translation initiation factor IF-2
VQADLVPEQWGGSTPFVAISAKKGDGIEELLETVALVAELEELQANPSKPAEGTVLEAHLDRQVGPVATLLVQAGTLRVRADRMHAHCYAPAVHGRNAHI